MKILIIGILGQDGTILTNLLKNDHKIFGVTHKNSLSEKILSFENKNKIKIESLDLKDYDVCEDLIKRILPDVIVNFAGITNIFSPWDDQIKLVDQNIKIPLNMLNGIKNVDDRIFFFQASSSLMFGQSKEMEITEFSELSPIYPYGLSKSFIHGLMNEYRKNLNLNCSSGIFFNHDSYYRGENFLTKKISIFLKKLQDGEKNKLYLGDLNGFVDISHAYDFMSGVKLIIENKISDNFIFSSGNLIKLYDLVKLFFDQENLNMDDYVVFDQNYIRKKQIKIYGNNQKLTSIGWKPKFNTELLVKDMLKMEKNYGNTIS